MSSKRVKRFRKAKEREVSTPPPAPSQLANLPDELLLVVIDYLSIKPTFGNVLFPVLRDDPICRRALVALCLTNRRLASFAKPALWRHPINSVLKVPGGIKPAAAALARLVPQCVANGHLIHSIFGLPYNGEVDVTGFFSALHNLQILTVQFYFTFSTTGIIDANVQGLDVALSHLTSLRYLSFDALGYFRNPWALIRAIPLAYSGYLQLCGVPLCESTRATFREPSPMPDRIKGLFLKTCPYDNEGLVELMGSQPRPGFSLISIEKCHPVAGPAIAAFASIQTTALTVVRCTGSINLGEPMLQMPVVSGVDHLEKLYCSVGLQDAPSLLNLPTSLRTVHIVELDKGAFPLIEEYIVSLPNLERLVLHLGGPIINDHAKAWRPYISKDDWNAVVAEALKLEETCRVRRVELWPSDIALAMKAVRRGKGEACTGPW